MGRDMDRAKARVNQLPVWIGGCVALVAAILVRVAVGSPHAALWQLGATQHLPPIWLLSILWLGFFFLTGCAWGYLLGACPRRGGCTHDAAVWRGSLCIVLSAVFAFLWYALLVGSLSLFLSWLCLAVAVVFALLCAFSWFSASAGAAWITVGFSLWLLILFLLHFTVILFT